MSTDQPRRPFALQALGRDSEQDVRVFIYNADGTPMRRVGVAGLGPNTRGSTAVKWPAALIPRVGELIFSAPDHYWRVKTLAHELPRSGLYIVHLWIEHVTQDEAVRSA